MGDVLTLGNEQYRIIEEIQEGVYKIGSSVGIGVGLAHMRGLIFPPTASSIKILKIESRVGSAGPKEWVIVATTFAFQEVGAGGTGGRWGIYWYRNTSPRRNEMVRSPQFREVRDDPSSDDHVFYQRRPETNITRLTLSTGQVEEFPDSSRRWRSR